MIKYTHEQLTHFICNMCQKWWSISEWLHQPTELIEMTCPHCFKTQIVQIDEIKI